ncbi:MAG: hypothetical protein WCV80_03365 [Candidatus Paceibacterota bacterium]
MELGLLFVYGIFYFLIITGSKFGKTRVALSSDAFLKELFSYATPKFAVALVACGIGYLANYATLDATIKTAAIAASFFIVFLLWAHLSWRANRRLRPKI